MITTSGLAAELFKSMIVCDNYNTFDFSEAAVLEILGLPPETEYDMLKYWPMFCAKMSFDFAEVFMKESSSRIPDELYFNME